MALTAEIRRLVAVETRGTGSQAGLRLFIMNLQEIGRMRHLYHMAIQTELLVMTNQTIGFFRFAFFAVLCHPILLMGSRLGPLVARGAEFRGMTGLAILGRRLAMRVQPGGIMGSRLGALVARGAEFRGMTGLTADRRGLGMGVQPIR